MTDGDGHAYPAIEVSGDLEVEPHANGSAFIASHGGGTILVGADEMAPLARALLGHAAVTGGFDADGEEFDAEAFLAETGAPRWAAPVVSYLWALKMAGRLEAHHVRELLGVIGMVAPSEADFEAEIARAEARGRGAGRRSLDDRLGAEDPADWGVEDGDGGEP